MTGARLEDFEDACRPGGLMDQMFDDLRLIQAKAVVKNPLLAGYKQDVGDWEAGEIWAVAFEYPTLEQARAFLAEQPHNNSPPR